MKKLIIKNSRNLTFIAGGLIAMSAYEASYIALIIGGLLYLGIGVLLRTEDPTED